MEIETGKTTKDKKPVEPDTPHKHTGMAVATIAMSVFGTFALGASMGAAWPAAVASCGLCVMGIGVAYVMLRRT